MRNEKTQRTGGNHHGANNEHSFGNSYKGNTETMSLAVEKKPKNQKRSPDCKSMQSGKKYSVTDYGKKCILNGLLCGIEIKC